MYNRVMVRYVVEAGLHGRFVVVDSFSARPVEAFTSSSRASSRASRLDGLAAWCASVAS